MKNKSYLMQHLAPYLPYKLMFQAKKHQFNYGKTEQIPMNGLAIDTDGNCQIEFLYDDDLVFSDTVVAKPILRPLEDLIKEITIDGKKPFVPIIYLFLKTTGEDKLLPHVFYNEADYVGIRFNTDLIFLYHTKMKNFSATIKGEAIHTGYQFELFQLLFKWHFDVFGMIKEGYALDINKL